MGNFFIVGIGASAGGLSVLQSLFQRIPADINMAFVVVQHLSPHHKTLMPELINKKSELVVRLTTDHVKVVPNEVYLIPPGKNMLIEDGHLRIYDRNPTIAAHESIDDFFVSLAENAQEKAIAIILSGTGTDGTEGIKSISSNGGFVMVQSPGDAQFDGMPLSAVNTGLADLVGSAETIADQLLHISEAYSKVFKGGELAEPVIDQRVFNQVISLIKTKYNINFADYKPQMLSRRIFKNMSLNHLSTPEEYADKLQQEPDLLDTITTDFLIGVSNFNRNPEAFAFLERNVIPALVEQIAAQEKPMRLWVAGCSTGEEAFSLAILVSEFLRKNNIRLNYKIFATDVNTNAIKFASEALYNEQDISVLPSNVIGRYFIQEGSNYRVIDWLRRNIIFSRHNIITDPPYINMDMISCRNMLIYFRQEPQQRILRNFHYAIRPGGCLFLGGSETLGEMSSHFTVINQKWRIFRKISSQADAKSISRLLSPQLTIKNTSVPRSEARPMLSSGNEKQLLLLQKLLDKFAPPFLLLNNNLEVTYFGGGIDNFLRFPRVLGALTNYLPSMASERLVDLVRSGIREAKAQNTAVRFADATFIHNEKEFTIDLQVDSYGSGQFVATFDLKNQKEKEGAGVVALDISEQTDLKINTLQDELDTTRIQLRQVIEQLESSNEELQSTNEQLLSSNEELQSTNEELQSVNEELYSVNAELQLKNQELQDTGSDLDNLLRSLEIATLFVDANMCIRRITPSIEELFNITDSDFGRPLKHFTFNFSHPGLQNDLLTVIQYGQKVEREIKHENGQNYLMRITPFTDGFHQQKGCVISFIDTTELALLQKQLSGHELLMDQIMNNSPLVAWVKDMEGKMMYINHNFERLLRMPKELVLGRTDHELFDEKTANALVNNDAKVLSTGTGMKSIESVPGPDGSFTYSLVFKFPIKYDNKNGIGGIAIDFTKEQNMINVLKTSNLSRSENVEEPKIDD